MGSKQKARQLLEASDAHKHYSSIIDNALVYFIANAEKEGKPVAEELKKIKSEYDEQFAEAIGLTEDIYAEVFTDEEMDELMVLQTNPAMAKLRGLTSDIFNRILEKFELPASQ